jgi:predicted 2-oxoglutarate/Fe(II)-dependent dioxygenase YbiX
VLFYIRTPFVIKYDAKFGTVSKLRTHKDNADASFILLINRPSEFTGGGTYFHAINKTIHLEQGEALIFAGQLVHEAIPITSGKRFVISGFITFNDEYIRMKRLGTLATIPLLF